MHQANVTYKRLSNSVSGLLDDELVMMDIKKGKYFSLNKVATRVWEIIEEPRTQSEICNALLTEYNVDPDTCNNEVSKLLDEMVKLGLVTKK